MVIGTMMGQLTRNWGWIALRGLVAILFGVLAFARPGITLTALVLVWGAYALLDGLFALFAGFAIKDGGRPMWPLVLVGIAGVAAGVLTFLRPQMTALVLLTFIAAWAVVTGVLEIAAAIRLRKVIANEWMLALAGVLSIAFGALMIARPGNGALAVIYLIGLYAVLLGVALLTLGFRLRSLGTSLPKPA